MALQTRVAGVAVVVLILGLAGTPHAQSDATAARRPFYGSWRLESYRILDPDGGPGRPGAYDVGRIFYDASGQMSAQLMNSANTADRSPSSDDERAMAYRRYLGYFGRFTVDPARGIVTHHVEGSSNPFWVGSNQVRSFAFTSDGTRLTLSLRDGNRVTQTLEWVRID